MAKGSHLLLPFLFGSALLYGCAPPTPAMVRGVGPERQYMFEAGENYRPVHEKILGQARKCFNTCKLTAQMFATGELRDDAEAGTITVEFYGIFATDTYQVIDVYGISDNGSLVIAYYSLGPVAENGAALKEWVLDNSTECEPKKKPDAK